MHVLVGCVYMCVGCVHMCVLCEVCCAKYSALQVKKCFTFIGVDVGNHSSRTLVITLCCSTGVSSYVLNNRLFPIPVHHHSEPGILCPVCEGSHDMDGAESVGVASARYIKVSIPRCTLQPVSRLRARMKREGPNGRDSRPSGRSPVSTESMGLSKVRRTG